MISQGLGPISRRNLSSMSFSDSRYSLTWCPPKLALGVAPRRISAGNIVSGITTTSAPFCPASLVSEKSFRRTVSKPGTAPCFIDCGMLGCTQPKRGPSTSGPTSRRSHPRERAGRDHDERGGDRDPPASPAGADRVDHGAVRESQQYREAEGPRDRGEAGEIEPAGRRISEQIPGKDDRADRAEDLGREPGRRERGRGGEPPPEPAIEEARQDKEQRGAMRTGM